MDIRRCHRCGGIVYKDLTGDFSGYSDELMKEFYVRRKESSLCDDCLIEDALRKLGESRPT
jgi:hypothetical protein